MAFLFARSSEKMRGILISSMLLTVSVTIHVYCILSEAPCSFDNIGIIIEIALCIHFDSRTQVMANLVKGGCSGVAVDRF